MPSRTLLVLSLVLAPSLGVAQTRLSTNLTPKTLYMSVAAQVTIPALSFKGDLAGAYVALNYVRVNTSGSSLEFVGPINGAGGSSTTLTSPNGFPGGNYGLQFDFVNVGQPMSFTFLDPNGQAIGTCNLPSAPGYNTVSSCSTMFGSAGGIVLASIQTMSGAMATLKQVTVTRYR